jgi:hypothetical protein
VNLEIIMETRVVIKITIPILIQITMAEMGQIQVIQEILEILAIQELLEVQEKLGLVGIQAIQDQENNSTVKKKNVL